MRIESETLSYEFDTLPLNRWTSHDIVTWCSHIQGNEGTAKISLDENCNFCRAMLRISAAYAVVRCPFACPFVWVSVTFTYCVETSKHILNFFFTVG